MNHPVREVLKEDISCLLIMELNRIRREGSKRKGRGTRLIGFLKGINFLGAMRRRLNERERARERRKTENTAEHKAQEKRRKTMCNA